MIKCEQCYRYAHGVWMNGDINVDQITEIAISRHKAKGCEKIHEDFYLINRGMNSLDQAFDSFRKLNHDPLREDHALKWGIADLILMVYSICRLVLSKDNDEKR
jgi:hypothetical protein